MDRMNVADPPDASALPVDDVRDAFARGLESWQDEPRVRPGAGARVLLGRRELATAALTPTLALLDWLCLDVLPGVDPAATRTPRGPHVR
jgi:hypothetical protein